MGTYDLAQHLVGLVKSIVDIKSSIEKSGIERQVRVAEFLTRVAVVIEQIASSFERDGTPSAECAELRGYVTQLEDIVGDYLDPEALRHYKAVLASSCNIRGVLYMQVDAGSADNALAMLRGSAGQLRALANTIKAR